MIERKNSTDYSDRNKRLETFFTWPKTAYLQPFDLAEAGFIYVGTGDAVKCYKCGVSLKNWEPEDNAWAEHEKFSQVCPLVIERVRQVNAMKQQRQQHGNGFYQSQSYGRQPMAQEASYSSLDENHLREQHQQKPYHPSYLYESSRSLPAGAEKYKYDLQQQQHYQQQHQQQQYLDRLQYLESHRSSITESPPHLNGYRPQVGGDVGNNSTPQYYQRTGYPVQNSMISNSMTHNNIVYPHSQPYGQGGHRYGTYQRPLTKSRSEEMHLSREGTNKYFSSSSSSHSIVRSTEHRHPSVPKETLDYGPLSSSSSYSPDTYSSLPSSRTSSPVKRERKSLTPEDIKKLVEMGFKEEVVQRTIDCYTEYASRSFGSLDDLAQAVIYFQDHNTLEGTPFGRNLNVKPSKAGEEMIFDRAKNDKPVTISNETDRQSCKICMDNDVEVTFVPCGHLICLLYTSPSPRDS